MDDKIIFLLGGHDLEMVTIARILKEKKYTYFDNDLNWDNANLSSYNTQLQEYGNKAGITIFGIELNEDISILPDNVVFINHHDESSNKKSSLEQVIEIIGYDLNKELRLIAANDSRYIPGMIEAGATEAEIDAIRAADRKAQGVTEQDEKDADKAIEEHLDHFNELKIISNAPSKSFSAICDKMYPFSSLAIYNDNEICYYGHRATEIYNSFKNAYGQLAYCGGGDNGFTGIDLKHSDMDSSSRKTIIINSLNIIKDYNMTPYSYHIFYFPFKWEFYDRIGKNFSEKYDITNLNDNTQYWRHVQIPQKKDSSLTLDLPESEAKELFDERQYFFEFVNPVLYDIKGDETPIIRHYERLEPRNNNVYYEIQTRETSQTREKTYTLRVESINLNIYSTGIGILIFHLGNYKFEQSDESSVRDINQFGRRIMPPFSGEFNPDKRKQTALRLKITGLEESGSKRYEDSFDYSVNPGNGTKGIYDVWTPSTIMSNLVKDAFPEISIKPVIDDRMLVNCWYGNDNLSRKIKDGCLKTKSENNTDDDFKNFWYKYVFIDDGKDTTCQNDKMKDDLIENSTYFRWQKYGTLYGISRYSIVALTDTSEYSRNIILMHMRTIYARMFELVIVQSASVLSFSGDVTVASSLHGEASKTAEQISSLYKEYIRFVNQFYFRNVTAQDQGIELYNILSRQFDTEKQIKDLDGEINELNQYASLLIDQKRNENGEKLNKLAAYFLPPSLFAGILGINGIPTDYFWAQLIIAIFLSLLFIIIIKCWLKK